MVRGVDWRFGASDWDGVLHGTYSSTVRVVEAVNGGWGGVGYRYKIVMCYGWSSVVVRLAIGSLGVFISVPLEGINLLEMRGSLWMP